MAQAAGSLSQLGSNKGLKTSKNKDLLNSKILGGLGRGERRGKARGLGRGRGLNREDASDNQEGIGEVLPIIKLDKLKCIFRNYHCSHLRFLFIRA